MSRLIKQIMVAALVAVAMLGGGELPILHAQQFAEAHAFVHQHMHADATADHAEIAYDHASSGDQDDSTPPGSDRGCTHVHAHCCASAAIMVAVETAPPAASQGQMRIERNGAIPYGQLSRPPLRPPRQLA